MARKKKQEPRKARRGPPKFEPPKNAGYCPACGEPIVWMRACGHFVPCHPQRRLAVFDFKRTDEGLPVDDAKAFSTIEERTGRVVLARRATSMEVEQFKQIGTMGLPYTIGRDSHFCSCERLDKWFAGSVEVPRNLVAD